MSKFRQTVLENLRYNFFSVTERLRNTRFDQIKDLKYQTKGSYRGIDNRVPGFLIFFPVYCNHLFLFFSVGFCYLSQFPVTNNQEHFLCHSFLSQNFKTQNLSHVWCTGRQLVIFLFIIFFSVIFLNIKN